MKNAKSKIKSKKSERTNSRVSVFEEVRSRKLRQPIVEVPVTPRVIPNSTTLIKRFRVPHMTTLASCRRVQRNILRLVADERLSSRKALVMNRIVNSIADITKQTSAEEENKALREAFERAISRGSVSRDSLPLLFEGTVLSQEFLPSEE